MIQFFILNGTKRTCAATDSHKAAEILRLMFHGSKGYVVENNKIAFAQNMSVDEAEISHGIKPMQSMTVLPVAPKAAKVKPTVKPAKSKAKKTTLKSKVVIKNNKKSAPKKVVVKVKPKVKVKAKKPVAKVKAKVKGKKR
jgi:hypothetical protein